MCPHIDSINQGMPAHTPKIHYNWGGMNIKNYGINFKNIDVVDVKHDFIMNKKFQMPVYKLNHLAIDF